MTFLFLNDQAFAHLEHMPNILLFVIKKIVMICFLLRRKILKGTH